MIEKAKDDDFGGNLAGMPASLGKSPVHSTKWERVILDKVIIFF
jgi:hypothetical protein